MATVVAVHGTFAHSETDSSIRPTEASPQWWQHGSEFERDLKVMVEAADGQVQLRPFKWSGENSELGRRAAGAALYRELRALDARGEPYCVVGHSHGGSVIASALLEASRRKQPLNGLRRWITIGTPFIVLRRERWLFTRLDLWPRTLLVASFMLLLMFGVYFVADWISGGPMLFGATFPGVLAITGLMMSLPALAAYVVLRVWDGRKLLLYRRAVTDRARNTFGPRWLSLAHSDDEAIQGLGFLPAAKLKFFDESFAVHTLTIVSVIAVPLLYLAVLLSPPLMVGLADWLRNDVYRERTSPEAMRAVSELRAEFQAARRASGSEGQVRTREQRRAIFEGYREKRKALEARHSDIAAAERAVRFEQRFFTRDGSSCEGLCGEGRELRMNAGLLLHVVTDELSWSLGAADIEDWRTRWITSLALPAVLVPIIFGLLALVLMVVFRLVAMTISAVASRGLNTITNSEVKRAAYGNDTEGEIAVGVLDRPTWLDAGKPRLPEQLGHLVTEYSNGMATQSIAKFRRAIGQIAAATPSHSTNTAIATYFTWKELVHSAYLDVPEFRKLVAHAVARADGFRPTAVLAADPDFALTGQWLAELEGGVAAEQPAHAAPTERDASAVSAVVASTVKAEP